MQLRHRLLLVAAALSIVTARPAEAREERTVAIGGHELVVALADGDCFFDPDRPPDHRLIDALSTAAGDRFVVLLAFAACPTIETWRTGNPPTLARFGYVMIAETHLEPVFAFEQPALAEAIAQALADRGVPDYKADIVRLAGDVERTWPGLPPGGRQELGIVHRDRFGPVIATVLSVPAPDGKPMPRIMLHQSILAAGKVLSVVTVRDYRDSESIFDAYGDLSAVAEATAARNGPVRN